MNSTLYFIAESGEILEKLAAWRERYIAVHKTYFEFARAKGSPGVYTSNFDGSLIALMPMSPPPEGWAVKKRKRGAPDWMVPMTGKTGAVARAEIEALGKPPSQWEVVDIVGHPGTVSYKTKEGKRTGSTSLGEGIFPVQIFFPSGDGPIFIQAGNPDPVIADLRNQFSDVVIECGEWSVPPGLRLLTEAEKDLIMAQDRVRIESLDREAA